MFSCFTLSTSVATPQPFQYYPSEGRMSGGSPPRWRAGVPASLNPPTITPENTIVQRPDNSSHAQADIAAQPGGSGDHSGISNVTQFTVNATSHQRTIPDHVLDNSHEFDDTPYVPPRLTQAELQPYPALDPRLSNIYDSPTHDLHLQYPYEGDTSPAESHHSIESNWSTSSSSSTSSQQLPGDYFVDLTTRYSQTPLTTRQTYPQHYPAYHGQHRRGLEHVRYGEHPSNVGGPHFRSDPQGYSADGLSPEIFGDSSSRVGTPSQMNNPPMSSQGSSSSSTVSATNLSPNITTFSASPAPPMDSPSSNFPDAGPYLRQQLGLSLHAPVNLQSLPDPPPGQKPSAPLPMLVKLAIYGSPNKQLTLQEIYTALERRFQWFRDHRHEKAWKNSIRHNLSLNKVFQHVPRPATEPGKGSYWQLDISGGEGYKRSRKRRPRNRSMVSEEDEDTSEIEEDRSRPSDSTGPTRLSATPIDDANIDPGLRSEGHVVGEGRTRSATRRAGGGPYPSQPPRFQPGPLAGVSGQDASAAGPSSVRFGQPSFGQTSFPAYPQTRQMSVPTPSVSFATLSSSPVEMVPGTSVTTRPSLQLVVPYDRTARISNPQPIPRSGIEYVAEPGGLPAARRVKASPGRRARGESQEDASRSSAEPSSSPPRTWNDGRFGNKMQGS